MLIYFLLLLIQVDFFVGPAREIKRKGQPVRTEQDARRTRLEEHLGLLPPLKQNRRKNADKQIDKQ